MEGLKLPTGRVASLLGIWQEAPLRSGVALLLSLGIVTLTITSIYRIWIHPLSVFPGPKTLAVTNLSEQWKSNITGSWFREVSELHRRYGPIVRIGPNRLAIDGSIGWPHIFAHRAGKAEFSKPFDFFFPGSAISILGAPTEAHRRQRRQLSHAFSDAALKGQEDIVTKYIDMLANQLAKRAETGQPINIANWFSFTTFDIIGDLTFTESFHSLETGDYNKFVLNFFKSIRAGARTRLTTFYPLLYPIIRVIFGNEDHAMEKEQRSMAEAKAQSRMALGIEPTKGRQDFMTYMLRQNREGERGITHVEALLNSNVLVIAGSETTASALCGLFFYTGQDSRIYGHLTQEIRGRFQSEAEINMKSTEHLEYLHAVIEETLRIYPPAIEVPPRISPGFEIEGKFLPKGTLCSVYQWATNRNPKHFAHPDSYIPERWLPPSHSHYDAKFANDNRSVFKPFSYGPRDCIGKNLAYSEMRVVVSRLLYRFDFRLAPGQEKWHDSQQAFLTPNKGPLNIYLEPRETSRA